MFLRSQRQENEVQTRVAPQGNGPLKAVCLASYRLISSYLKTTRATAVRGPRLRTHTRHTPFAQPFTLSG